MPYLKIPGIISLGGGYPDPDSFALRSLRFDCGNLEGFEIGEEIMRKAAQYNPSEGYVPFVESVRQWQKKKNGVLPVEDQVLVLNGSQEGLFILGFLFIDPGDCVIVGDPTYPGAIAAFRPFRPTYRTVPCDHEGMNTEALGRLLAEMRETGDLEKVKFVYVIPNADNPGGSTLSPSRRAEMMRLAGEYDLLIVEDDPYELLSFGTEGREPTLQSLGGFDHVLRLDSFSKIFIPGLRLGYASGPAEVVRKMTLFKQAANLHTNSVGQALAGGYLAGDRGDLLLEHTRRVSRLYRRKRDRMVEALEDRLPGETSFHPPEGGMFLWVRIVDDRLGIDTRAMMDAFIETYKIIAVPGIYFSVAGACGDYIRLSYSTVGIDDIDEGIRRLAAMIGAYKESISS